MAIEPLNVKEIIPKAVNGTMDIPEFQSDFVWDAEQVKRLAESLFRNYPIGSFLRWESSGYVEQKTVKGFGASLWIVDGQ